MSSGNPEKQQKVDGSRVESFLISLQLRVCVKVEAPPVSGWTVCKLSGFNRTKTLRQRAIQLAQFVLLPGYREPEKAGIEL
jgi:hypothetical protein